VSLKKSTVPVAIASIPRRLALITLVGFRRPAETTA
jgi:hypothetical protein